MKKFTYISKILDAGDSIPKDLLREMGDAGFQLVTRHAFTETIFDEDYRGGLGRDLNYARAQLIFMREELG